MELSIIVAMTPEGVIGDSNRNRLPWPIQKADMGRFRDLTRGKPLIMGRRTWESLPRRPLDGRTCTVLTAHEDSLIDGVHADCCASWDEAMHAHDAVPETVVLGGTQPFMHALASPWLRRIYLTVIQKSYAGDIVFPLSVAELLQGNRFTIATQAAVPGSVPLTFYTLETAR